ncbi:non-intrinsic ABC protein 3 [Prunus dulcis]|uniref:Non-intrinsic ABC protein 3 n=1 Tax=Prunus dulcis TaxID=3755 RepID=A0A4Y1QLR7_PRUDU|nr:non-intrinsic ABC protein 3 [Prunus dulcis]
MAVRTDGDEAAREHLLTVDIGEADGDVKFRIRNLTKKSETTGCPILNGLSLDIPKGVIVGSSAPVAAANRRCSELSTASGSLHLGLSSWTVMIFGTWMFSASGARSACSSSFLLFLKLLGTVADNIRYGPQLRGKKLSDQDVHKLLTLVDLDSSFFSKTGSEMSVGQAQRVALARTLANSPEVLLLDEPTSALDPISTEHIEGALEKLKKKQGMTIIMVSHSIKQIQRIADIVCLLVDGEIVEVLKPDQLSQAQHPMALRFLELSS